MTRKVGKTVVIEDEPDQVCKRCNRLKETREVLVNGTRLCIDCATPAELDAYARRLFGTPSN